MTATIEAATQGHVHLIDDDPSVRRGLSFALSEAGYSIHAYESAEAFLQAALPLSPAVVLLDMRLTGMSGVELQARLRELGHTTPIVFISGESLPAEIVAAMKQGATDFLVKPFSMEELLQTLATAMRRDVTAHQQTVRSMRVRERYAALTPREREVCALMIKGHGNKEIGELLGAAAATIKLHRGRVLLKMGVDSLAQLLRLVEGIPLDAP